MSEWFAMQIYVVDCADRRRVEECRDELEELLDEDKLAGVPLLVFANKQDLINAAQPDEVAETLDLQNLKDRAWHIEGCSAKNGTGLQEGVQWATSQVGSNK